MNIDPKKEIKKITNFLLETSQNTGIDKFVLGLSGGIDSATSLYLLNKTFSKENIFVYHLYYFEYKLKNIELIKNDLKIPEENFQLIDIKPIVDVFQQQLKIEDDNIRLGNIMARTRMMILFDQAKKLNALVFGTENRSEHYLSYFTRFGDEASDIEPIKHLFKTQVWEIAKELSVPNEIIEQKPSADLWVGQSDEEELGFSYIEADEIMHLYFDKKLTVEEIENKGHGAASKVINWIRKQEFKHKVPYFLDPK